MSPTRFYLPSSGTPAISPGYNAGWERTTDAARITAVTAKSNTSLTVASITNGSGTAANNDILARQYIYPIPAGKRFVFTTSDTIKGQILVRENLNANDFRSQITMYVFGSNGSTLKATLLDFDTGALANEWVAATLTNRKFPRGSPATLATNYTTLAGEYLVWEIGYRQHATGANSQGDFNFGDRSASSDLPEDETTDDGLNPTTAPDAWIELSTSLTDIPASVRAWILE